MYSPKSIPLCGAAALLLCFASHAQDATNVAAPGPDPKPLLIWALKLNDLTADPAQPWHIKATYQLFDRGGTPTDSGTYEESWSSPTKSKRSFTLRGATRTDYTTDKGVFRSGKTDSIDPTVYQAIKEVTQPIPSEAEIEKASLTFRQVDIGQAKFNCVRMGFSSDFCLGIEKPILRITALGPDQLVHNRILHFQDHVVPGDLKIMSSGQTLLTLHVDSIEPLGADADFTPPADAVPVPKMIQVSDNVARGMITYAVQPDYPSAARTSRMEGTVVLQAKITKDGTMEDLKVLSGPKVFQGAAIEAVRHWRYKPYLLNGEPVEVLTTINVIFSLHR